MPMYKIKVHQGSSRFSIEETFANNPQDAVTAYKMMGQEAEIIEEVQILKIEELSLIILEAIQEEVLLFHYYL